MKTRRMIILLSFLAVILMAYVFSMPAPAPMSELEKAEIAKKIEWSGHGNIMTGKLPVVEIPKKNPIFRIVRVFSSEISENKYHFKEYCPTIDIDFSSDIGEIIRDHYRAEMEKAI
jgi:hypothetical protein